MKPANFILIYISFLTIAACTQGQKSNTIDPFRNGRLTEQFNPEQIDFHKEYYDLRQKFFDKSARTQSRISNTDFSTLWITGDWEQNGVIGSNYQRIQIHIDKVIKDSNKLDTYLIFGQSKVNTTICDFKGEIKALKTYFVEQCDDPEKKNCGVLFAEYRFDEDSLQNHSGYFRGISETSFYLDDSGDIAQIDESSVGADGYANRTFVGTWTDYRTNKSKKCIWGDYRLPFTFDFDQGDGEMMVNKKYEKYGWQTYNDGSEILSLPNGSTGLKNKWWLVTKK